MPIIKFSAIATGANKANYTFPSAVRIKSVRFSGFFIGAANGDDFQAEISKSPASELQVNAGAGSQSIAAVSAGCDLAASNEAFNSQSIVNVHVGKNESIYLNLNFDAGSALCMAYIDFE